MFLTIEPFQYHRYARLISSMYAQRVPLRPLSDDLVEVPSNGRDAFDELMPVYLVETDPEMETVRSSARLLPSTGRTPLQDAPHRLWSDVMLQAPSVWELSQLRIGRHPATGRDPAGPARLFGAMHCLLSCAGIEAITADLDAGTLQDCRRFEVTFDVLGTAGFGSRTRTLALVDIGPVAAAKLDEQLAAWDIGSLVGAVNRVDPGYFERGRVAGLRGR